MTENKIAVLVLVLCLAGCTVKPVEIQYGRDNCSMCEMTIVDQRYGAEVVTAKGKVYKFDSIECLADFLKKKLPEGEVPEYTLVTSYTQPGKLSDALHSHILHSKGLPSPMGKYLTAFADQKTAEGFQKAHGGRIYDWDDFMASYEMIHNDFLE